jgi:hypothetical protein
VTVTDQAATNVSVSTDVITVTFDDTDTSTGATGIQGLKGGEEITIKFTAEIDNPEAVATAKATVDNEGSNEVGLGVVLNADPQTPGSNSYITVEVASANGITALDDTSTIRIDVGDRIILDMGSFQLPASISRNDVSITGLNDDGVQVQSGTPSEVIVSGKKVTLYVPDMNTANDTLDQLSPHYKIAFRQAAGVKIRATEGSSSVTADSPGGETVSNTIMFDRVARLSAAKGKSGSSLTISGNGWNKPVSAVFIDQPDIETISAQLTGASRNGRAGEIVRVDGTDDGSVREYQRWDNTSWAPLVKPPGRFGYPQYHVEVQDIDDEVLGQDPSLTAGAFSVTVTVDNKFRAGDNYIFIEDIDGRLNFAGIYHVNPSITVDKASAQLGEEFEVTFNHFRKGYTNVQTATIAGLYGENDLTADAAASSFSAIPRNKIKYLIPSTILDPGLHEVRVVVSNSEGLTQEATANITVGGLPLTFTPASAVPGQQITIRGVGFTRRATIARITIGVQDIVAYDLTSPDGSGGRDYTRLDTIDIVSGTVTAIKVNNNGEWTGSIKIPESVVDTGAVQIAVTEGLGERLGNNRTGAASITIPNEQLTFEPPSGRPGSTVTIGGSGFTASSTVLIYYDGKIVDSANAGSDGSFSKEIVVPIDTDVGRDNVPVRAETSIPDRFRDIWAPKIGEASHTVPAGILSVTPEGGPPGTVIYVSGKAFKAFTPYSLTIGGLNVLTTEHVNTDGDGNFSESVVVPPLREGIHALVAQRQDLGLVGQVTAETFPFRVGDIGPATLPSELVFEDLVDADNLIVVWSFDNATKEWAFYDPRPEVASAVDLTEITTGDNVWIQVTANQEFQRSTPSSLTAGWNLVTIK